MKSHRTSTAVAGISGGLVVFALALVFGRADVAIIGLVPILAVAVATARGGIGPAPVVSASEMRRASTDRSAMAEVTIGFDAPGADLLMLAIDVPGIARRLITVAARTTVTVRVPLVHSGPQILVSASYRLVTAEAQFVTAMMPIAPVSAVVHPELRPVPALPVPARLSGLTGGHASTRLGDGGEFRDIHPFTVGDRLRRIDWKATARLGRSRGDLYVRRTQATSDVDVALLVDDAGEIPGVLIDWFAPASTELYRTDLDVAREAAWSLGKAYLDAADQVSFQVLSRVGGAVPRGSGARHRERLRAAITATQGQPMRRRYLRTPIVAAGAMVIVFSPFLDEDVVHLIALWRAAGHAVLAVDTLPAIVETGLDRAERAAARMVLGSRSDHLHDVRAMGASVLVWDTSAGSRAARLHELARSRRRP